MQRLGNTNPTGGISEDTRKRGGCAKGSQAIQGTGSFRKGGLIDSRGDGEQERCASGCSGVGEVGRRSERGAADKNGESGKVVARHIFVK